MFRRLLWLLLGACAASAAVRRVEITERVPVLNGAYERVTGRVHFGMNPKVAADRIVRDLDLAVLDAAGEAESEADFYILQPSDRAKSNGTALFEVSNGGGKAMLSRFNLARGANDFGDEWVMKQGYTPVWLGCFCRRWVRTESIWAACDCPRLGNVHGMEFARGGARGNAGDRGLLRLHVSPCEDEGGGSPSQSGTPGARTICSARARRRTI